MQQDNLARSAGDALSETATRELPRNVRVLGLTSLLNDIASEMIYPLIPTFLMGVLGGGTRSLGVIEGVADTTASLVKLWSGGLSDRAGKRKPFVLVGYLVAATSRPIIGLATAPWQVLLVRSGDRFGKGIRAAPRDAMIADSTSPSVRGRAFGFNRAMDHLGAAIGPALAFAFLYFWPDQLRTLFLLAAIPGAVVVAIVLFALHEPPSPSQRETAAQAAAPRTPLGRDFRLYLIALVVFTLGNSSDAFLLVRVGELGVAQEMLPLLWCAFHIVKSAGSMLAGRAVDTFGPRPLIYLGWFIYALVYLAFSLATDAWQGWTCFLIYGLFFALTEPAERTMVANLVGDEKKGLAYGWFNFAIGVAALPSSVIFGAIYQSYGGPTAFSWSAGLALSAVVLLSTVGRGQRLANATAQRPIDPP